jgi:hypothetical protein
VSQQLAALERGNERRTYRAQIKKRIKSGEMDPADILSDKSLHPDLEGMGVNVLLAAQERWGSVRARKLLDLAGVRETKTLGELSLPERAAIVELLP